MLTSENWFTADTKRGYHNGEEMKLRFGTVGFVKRVVMTYLGYV